MIDKKIGDRVDFKIERYNEHSGQKLTESGTIIGFLGEYALVVDSEDSLKAIEPWRFV